MKYSLCSYEEEEETWDGCMKRNKISTKATIVVWTKGLGGKGRRDGAEGRNHQHHVIMC